MAKTRRYDASGFCLTRREHEVVHLVSLGKSSKEISDSLKISDRTAVTHRAKIMRKLNVHSVTELLYRVFAPSSSGSDS